MQQVKFLVLEKTLKKSVGIIIFAVLIIWMLISSGCSQISTQAEPTEAPLMLVDSLNRQISLPDVANRRGYSITSKY